MSKKKILKVPFDKETDKLYTGAFYQGLYYRAKYDHLCNVKDNYIFETTIKFHKRIPKDAWHNELYMFVDSNGDVFRMFPSDIMDCLESMNCGTLDGKFTFTCKGDYFGIKYVGPRDNTTVIQANTNINHNSIFVY